MWSQQGFDKNGSYNDGDSAELRQKCAAQQWGLSRATAKMYNYNNGSSTGLRQKFVAITIRAQQGNDKNV